MRYRKGMKTIAPLLLAVGLAASAPAAEPAAEPSAAKLPAANVVYFIPSDLRPCTNYHARLNVVLREMKAFFDGELRRHGSPARFRLQTDPARPDQIRIFTVHGKEPHTGYPRNGGGAKAHKEVEAYFAANPGLKDGRQTLVLMPCEGPEYGPYHGWGVYCFAIDYSELDVRFRGAKNPKGKKFAKYFGGMAHEFGHAFGLPHNHATKSDEKAFGTAIMGEGNYTLGDSPTFLTAASAKLLEVADCSRPDPMPAKPSRHVMGADGATFEKTPQGVRVRGKLPVPNDLHALLAYYDKDKWAGVNNNYDAESFVVPVAPDGSFDFLMPLSEIHPGRTPYVQAQLRYVYKDGTQQLLRHTLDPKPEKEE